MKNSNYLCAPFRGKFFLECGAIDMLKGSVKIFFEWVPNQRIFVVRFLRAFEEADSSADIDKRSLT